MRLVACLFRSQHDWYLYIFYCCFISNSLFMVSLYKRYFGCLSLLRFSDVEENSEPRATRMPCRVVCPNIWAWCLKWHKRLNPKETKPMADCRSLTIALYYGDLTLGGAELEDVESRYCIPSLIWWKVRSTVR